MPREPHAPILLVDDDDDSRAIIGALLSLYGFTTIEHANSGVAALEKLASGLRPGLIVLDWRMPSMSGDGVLAALQSTPAYATIPVVILSSVAGLKPGGSACRCSRSRSTPTR